MRLGTFLTSRPLITHTSSDRLVEINNNNRQKQTKTDAELGFKLILLPFCRILNFGFSRSLFSFLIPAFCFQMRLPLNRVCCFRECKFYHFLPKNFWNKNFWWKYIRNLEIIHLKSKWLIEVFRAKWRFDSELRVKSNKWISNSTVNLVQPNSAKFNSRWMVTSHFSRNSVSWNLTKGGKSMSVTKVFFRWDKRRFTHTHRFFSLKVFPDTESL